MADKRCDNGHFIDEAWDICPYCPQDESEPEIPVVRPARLSEAPRSITSVPTGPGAVPVPRREPPAASQPSPFASSASGSPAGSAQPATAPMERTIAVARIDASQPKRYVVGWLVALSGSTRGEAYPVRMGRNVIGRDRRSDIVVNDDQASSHHADLVFRPEEKRFILMDHNSTNGTYVDENEIEPRRDLSGNEIIRIGSHKYVFTPLCHDGFYWDDEGLLK